MCHSTEYDHLTDPDPEPEPQPVDDAYARWLMVERSRLLALSGLPLEADALVFAQSLRFVP